VQKSVGLNKRVLVREEENVRRTSECSLEVKRGHESARSSIGEQVEIESM